MHRIAVFVLGACLLAACEPRPMRHTQPGGGASSSARVVASSSAVFVASQSSSVSAIPNSITVLRAVDGDTLEVSMENGAKEKVRVLGIDTPETVDPRKEVQCFGKDASQKMKDLLVGKVVTLIRDPAQDKDVYKRLLRYVDLNGTDIGAQMIREGYAYSYKKYPHPRLSEYNALELQARESARGLWGSCATSSK